MFKIKRNNIIHEMHQKGVTPTEIARELKIDVKTVYNIINKKNTPSVAMAKSFAHFFRKNIEEIFEFEEE